MSIVVRRNAEARRLLGLRRAVHFTLASGSPPPPARPPVAVIKAGTTPKVGK